VILEAVLQSFILVFIGEMGDKTQLLALVLTSRYRRPWPILAGIFVATLLNHGLSAGLGTFLSHLVSARTLSWILALAFFAFAAWVLVPDKEEELESRGHWGVFFTTVVAFFLAEMGDKTQLVTVALGAMFANVWLVTLGTTLGMLAANALAVFCGQRLLQKISMKWVRLVAALFFLLSGALVLYGAYFVSK
jgi:putative Ca2+/H+ antiporter (TMEM165/GDT1 family)